MKAAAILLAAFSLALAGSAAAAGRVNDVDYLEANRCKGLAAGLGVDTAPFASFIKTEGRTRMDAVIQRGDEEYDRAKRQTRDANLKDRLTAELNGACAAYAGAGQSMAGGAAATGAH